MSREKRSEDAALTWQEISCEHIVQDEWIDFRRLSYRLPDGSVFSPYYSYSRRDYVVIVASDEEGKYLCVRQFRQGIREVTTEFVAGGIERKDGREYDGTRGGAGNELTGSAAGTEAADTLAGSAARAGTGNELTGSAASVGAEDALAAARRELREETGYEGGEWAHLLTVPSNATIADNYAHLFVARNCHKATTQDLDETEFLQVVRLTAEEIDAMVAAGEFKQAVHCLAWLLSRRGALAQK